MSAEATLGESIAERIAAAGPISLHDYMAAANAHYYATRDPLGSGGDFVTAPEISQMFGELIGLWLADQWVRSGRPEVRYVELGPGRGTLAADARRAMALAGLDPPMHLVETSVTLREAQRARVVDAVHHDDVADLPEDRPLLIVANEFFDALPIRQIVRTEAGWRERMLVNDRAEPGRRFLPVLGLEDAGAAVPAALADAERGAVVERCPAGQAVMRVLADKVGWAGGVILAIDYGYIGPVTGDSFQAVQAHRFADPFVEPGTRDLTAHVDFAALAARLGGLRLYPLVDQGAFLAALGIGLRADQLAAAQPQRRIDIQEAALRLTHAAAMGRLFKVMAATAPDWPRPGGWE